MKNFLVDLNTPLRQNITEQTAISPFQVRVAYTTHYNVSQNPDIKSASSDATKLNYIHGYIDQESIALKTANDWKMLYDVTMGGSWDTLNSIMAGLTMGSFVFDSMMQKLWMKSTPTPLEIKIKFIARNDPYEEVWLPTFILLSMAHPIILKKFNKKAVEDSFAKISTKKDSLFDNIKEQSVIAIGNFFEFLGDPSMLGSPMCTSTGDRDGGKFPYFLYLQIGKTLTLQDCILTDVSINIPTSNISSDGYPLESDVTLSLLPQKIWTKETILNILTTKATIATALPTKLDTKFLEALGIKTGNGTAYPEFSVHKMQKNIALRTAEQKEKDDSSAYARTNRQNTEKG